MPRYAKFNEYMEVRLKHDRPGLSDHPFTELDVPRPVTTNDLGIILEIYDLQPPGYTIEFFDAEGRTVDLLDVHEDQIEPWELRNELA
jgi:hypothetical protein